MGHGSYLGGSTIIRPTKKKTNRKTADTKSTKRKKSPEEREAQLQERIKQAAEKLARTQAEFDAGAMRRSGKPRRGLGPKLSGGKP